MDETKLRRSNSRWVDLDGIAVHYMKCSPCTAAIKRAIHLCHGFGANLFTWEPCRQRVADALEGTVTAHDMPGFGLTER